MTAQRNAERSFLSLVCGIEVVVIIVTAWVLWDHVRWVRDPLQGQVLRCPWCSFPLEVHDRRAVRYPRSPEAKP